MKSKVSCKPFTLAGRMKALVYTGRAASRVKRKELFANSSLLGDTNELDTTVALKQKWYFRRDGENFLIPHLLLSTQRWVQHRIFKCSCSHYGMSVKHCWEFMHYLFTLAYNDMALIFRSRTVWDKCSTKGIWQTVEWMSSDAVVEESRGKHWNSV